MVCDQYKRLESCTQMKPNQKMEHTHTHTEHRQTEETPHSTIVKLLRNINYYSLSGISGTDLAKSISIYSSSIWNTFAMDNQQRFHKYSSKRGGLFLPAMLDLGILTTQLLWGPHICIQPNSLQAEKSVTVRQSTMEPYGTLNKGSYQRCYQNAMPMATLTIWNL